MGKTSAGILLYRRRGPDIEVLLVHPGGPYFARRDDGAWSIPKGEVAPGEDLLAAARREFREETGFSPEGEAAPLPARRQAGGKVVHAFAVAGDADPSALRSGTFAMEWPPRSGATRTFPEADRAEWFPTAAARRKIVPGQSGFLDDLEHLLDA